MAVVDKAQLLLVFESAEHKMASTTGPFAFTTKQRHEVFMLVHGIEVRGSCTQEARWMCWTCTGW